MNQISDSISRRRTFAIISHPDAGKTTLTEKLLLFGGAIQMAGAVKARGAARRAHSDWMKVERERGISVASSVMTYEFRDCVFNLLDTPGHEDFSEDTYRTLTAVDSAVMVIDAARGIETQTRKLFEVCRLRDVPIITFINKLDREGRDPFDLMDEIEQSLALDVTPASWPIGMGRDFLGCYDLRKDALVLRPKGHASEAAETDAAGEAAACQGLDDPKLDDMLPADAVRRLRDDIEMARGLCPELNVEDYRAGHLSPVFFGSAVNNFGVRELLDGLTELAPPPMPRQARALGRTREVDPAEDKVSGFVFKIQANMDPKHRDRIAFFRVTSGHFKRGMKLHHVRTNKSLTLRNPVLFLARERELAEEAWAGDIIGIPNHGNLQIGDTLTEGENLAFIGIPSFAPELLQAVRPVDPMRAKHLGRALIQLAEEGVARVFRPLSGANWIVGVVGQLQFEVMADRIRTEYEVPVIFEATALMTARWVEAGGTAEAKKFSDANIPAMAKDHEGNAIFLARNQWHLDRAEQDWPEIKFLKIREQKV